MPQTISINEEARGDMVFQRIPFSIPDFFLVESVFPLTEMGNNTIAEETFLSLRAMFFGENHHVDFGLGLYVAGAIQYGNP